MRIADPLTDRPGDPPPDYGRHHARCLRCGAFLCRYHSPIDDGGLCWPCVPGAEGVVIEVAPGEYRRFDVSELTQGERLASRLLDAVRADRAEARRRELEALIEQA